MEVQFSYQNEDGVEITVVAELDQVERSVLMASLLPLLSETIDQTMLTLLYEIGEEDEQEGIAVDDGANCLNVKAAAGRVVWGNH